MPSSFSFAFLFLFMVLQLPVSAQLQGTIRGEDGEVLPLATVHIQGTTRGVSANVEGRYQLELAPGNYQVVFQYIGHTSKTIDVVMSSGVKNLDVTLIEGGIELGVIEVIAGSEDPAYPIIREAIRRRTGHRDRLQGYQCRAYIKGGFQILSTPDSLFGQAMREAMGEDSTGFIYLSESEADISFERPNKRKEVMIASKVSGNSNGFSFNRFGILDFYQNTLDIGRPLVNPIADNALSFYTYKLLQTYHDQDNREIHKIEVKPKRSEDPVFTGTLFILGENFHIHSLDLFAGKGNTKIDVIDTFVVQQLFVPIENAYWPLFQQNIHVSFGILGFVFGGNFIAVTSDYIINPTFPPGFFNKEIMRVEDDANKKDSLYFEERRPIPLTEMESQDYVRKDSIGTIRDSKPYQDSMDRVANRRVDFMNVIFGYTYRQTWNKRRFTVGPASDWFNAIQGLTLGIITGFRQGWREDPGRFLQLGGKYLFGFSDNKHRGQINGRFQFNGVDHRYIAFQTGHEVRNLNPFNSFHKSYDASLLLFEKSSVNRYYESTHAQLKAGSELGPGWEGSMSIGYELRNPLVNKTEYAFKDIDRLHPANDHLGDTTLSALLGSNEQLLWGISLSWQPGVRVISYPDQRFLTGSRYPKIALNYRGGHQIDGGGDQFHFLRLDVTKVEQIRSVFGSWSYRIAAGQFISSPSFYHDFEHFAGNPRNLLQDIPEINSFKTLPVYSHSTSTKFFLTHHVWDDNSYVFDKIPGVRKLGFSVLFGANHLWTQENGHYSELSAGLGRIGYKLIRPLSIHGVVVHENGQYRGTFFRVVLKMLPNIFQ